MSVEERLVGVEKELSYLRGAVEQMDKRLTKLENEVAHLREELRSEIREVRSRLWWVIGILVSMWSSTIALLIAILLKLIGFF